MPGAGRRRGLSASAERCGRPAPDRRSRARRNSTPSGRSTTSVSGTSERGRALRVAQQRGEIGGLAGAIDAALGIDEGVEPVRRRAAGDAAVGQIEGRRLEVEKGVVALAGRRRRQRRRRAALAARQARFEQRLAGWRRSGAWPAPRCCARSAARSMPFFGVRSSPAN